MGSRKSQNLVDRTIQICTMEGPTILRLLDRILSTLYVENSELKKFSMHGFLTLKKLQHNFSSQNCTL